MKRYVPELIHYPQHLPALGDRCCMILVRHWSKPAWKNMASLLLVVGLCTPTLCHQEGSSSPTFQQTAPCKDRDPGLRQRRRSGQDGRHHAGRLLPRRASPARGTLGSSAPPRKERGQGPHWRWGRTRARILLIRRRRSRSRGRSRSGQPGRPGGASSPRPRS